MYESERAGTVGLPPGDYPEEIAALAGQIEKLAVQVDDLWAAATMIRVTIENYGPRDMVSAWSKMLEEWRGKRKDQEREAARKREQSKE